MEKRDALTLPALSPLTPRAPPPPLIHLPSRPQKSSLQPIAETRARQSELWRSLILAYCRHEKVRE